MVNTIMNITPSKCEAVKNWKIKYFITEVSLESLRYRITEEGKGGMDGKAERGNS